MQAFLPLTLLHAIQLLSSDSMRSNKTGSTHLLTLTRFYHGNICSLHTSWTLSRTISLSIDGIPSSFPQYQHFSSSQLVILLLIFNGFRSYGLSLQWKFSIIIPILKPAKPFTHSSSYRPISSTNCLSEPMESLVTFRLQTYLETDNVLNLNQSRFRVGYSTVDPPCRF